jgi:uroporphyrinogen-III decarboxylase
MFLVHDDSPILTKLLGNSTRSISVLQAIRPEEDDDVPYWTVRFSIAYRYLERHSVVSKKVEFLEIT